MRFLGWLLVCLSGLITLAMAGVDSDQAEMNERMKAGGHILMIRHALAPGTGDRSTNSEARYKKQHRSIGLVH